MNAILGLIMPHVAFVPFTGLRVRDRQMLELGMRMPGLQRRAAAIAHLPALGLLTLAGMLPEDWTCSYRAVDFNDEAMAERICQESPTLVAVSALSASIEQAYAFCDALRRRRLPVVIGGLHATALPEEASQHADAVVVGQGEPVWRQVLADAAADCLQPIYRTPRTLVDIPWPAPRIDLIGPGAPRFTLQTQRGCPLACDFCGASRLLSPFREKPIAHIRAELAAIAAVQRRPLVELADDNTFAGPRDGHELLDALASIGAKWFTESDWRLGERPETLARLASSGCKEVLVGIESLELRYPGMGPKQESLTRIMNAVSAIQRAGVPVNGCFIVGGDGETPESIERLKQFILASSLAEVQLTLQTPFPGTPLYRRLRDAGRLLLDRGWSHYTLFDVTYQPDGMSVAELEREFGKLIQEVFSASATARRAVIRRDIWRGRFS